MKLVIDTETFITAVNWVTKTYDMKDNSAYVALKVDKSGNAHLFHVNGISYLKAPFTILDSELSKEETSKGILSLALEGKFLRSLAGVLASAKGAMEMQRDFSNAKDSLLVKTSNGKFTVPLLATNVRSEPVLEALGEVDDREYFDAVQRLAKLCDAGSAGILPAIAAVDVNLNVDDEKIVLMATDRYAFGEITIPYEASSSAADYMRERDNKSLLIPVESAVLISPSKGLTSSTTIVHDDKSKKVGYEFSDGRVAIFALKDAEPLNYMKLKEKTSTGIVNKLTVNTKEFKDALGMVSTLVTTENEIYLDLTEDNGLVVRDSNNTNRIAVETTDLDLAQDYTVKFVRSIINEAFHPIATEKLNVKWQEEAKTFVFEPVMDDGTILDNVFVFFVSSR